MGILLMGAPALMLSAPGQVTPVPTPPRVVQPAQPIRSAKPQAENSLQTAAPQYETVGTARSSIKVDSTTRQIPAGTLLRIAFNSAFDSRITQQGEPFTAIVVNDFVSDGNVVIPAGTIVRGRVNDVRRPGLFSKGGSIALRFDHVMLGSGELMPLDLNLSTENTIVNKAGALYVDPGIGKKVASGAERGLETFDKIRDAGVKTGKSIANGWGTVLTVPAAVVGGALAGSAVTTGKAVQAVVGKGESVVIQPGDSVVIDFGGSFAIPTAQ